MGQITVMTGPERRRRWSEEERIEILAEAFAPGACVADVSRRRDVSTSLIYTWRRKLREQSAAASLPVPEINFAQAVLADDEQPADHDPCAAVIYRIRRRKPHNAHRRPRYIALPRPSPDGYY